MVSSLNTFVFMYAILKYSLEMDFFNLLSDSIFVFKNYYKLITLAQISRK